MNIKKYRNFSGSTYLSIEQVISVISQHQKIVKYFACILHDKDLHDDGTKKVAHVHFMILCHYPYPLSSVLSWFQGFSDCNEKSINTFVEPCTSPLSMYTYFMHKDNPDKVKYDENDIISSDPLYFHSEECDCIEDNAFGALEMLRSGFSIYDVAKRYGRDFIIHYSSYKTILQDIQTQEIKSLINLKGEYENESNW